MLALEQESSVNSPESSFASAHHATVLVSQFWMVCQAHGGEPVAWPFFGLWAAYSQGTQIYHLSDCVSVSDVLLEYGSDWCESIPNAKLRV